jgi:hypothetical protein
MRTRLRSLPKQLAPAFLALILLAAGAATSGADSGPSFLPPPQGLQITTATQTSLTLTWRPVPIRSLVLQYNVYLDGPVIGATRSNLWT